MEMMKEKDIVLSELKNSGTSWTRNPFFEENGYVIIKNLYDPDKLICPPPEKPGQYNYRNKNLEDFEHIEVEGQVEGSIARYWHPHYRQVHSDIRKIIENQFFFYSISFIDNAEYLSRFNYSSSE